MENWEETVIEDTFPEAGEIYFLRPRGNPPSVIEREGKWGNYSMLKGMFWIYTDQDVKSPNITVDSPMIAHNFMVKPTVLYEFVGKWDDTKVFQCVCKAIGKITRLVIEQTYKAPVVHSQPQPTHPPPDPGPGAEPETAVGQVADLSVTSPQSVGKTGSLSVVKGQSPPQQETQPPAQPCPHPPMERVYTSDTVYICGVCDQRVVIV